MIFVDAIHGIIWQTRACINIITTVVSIKFRPKCPSCGIVGMDFITEFESNTKRKSGEAWYELVACIKFEFNRLVYNVTKQILSSF